jgi:hypothetical protein
MISSVSATSYASQVYSSQQSTPNPPTQPNKPESPAQDTIQISSAARTAMAGGDADHDGDSK